MWYSCRCPLIISLSLSLTISLFQFFIRNPNHFLSSSIHPQISSKFDYIGSSLFFVIAMRRLTPLKLWDQVRSIPNGRTLFLDVGSRFIGIATHYLEFQLGCFHLTTLDSTAYKDPEELCRDINLIAYNHNGCGLGFGFPAGVDYRSDPLTGFFVKNLINRLQNAGCRLPFTLVNEDLTTCKADDQIAAEGLQKNPRLINMYVAEQIGKVFLARVTEDNVLREIITDMNFDYE